MTIVIPKNDYSRKHEVREDVVQEICNVMLKGTVWHPKRGGRYRDPNNELMADKKDGVVVGEYSAFGDNYWHGYSSEHAFKPFNEDEMRAAWNVLIMAGYHIYRIYEYKTWLGYVCDKRDWYDGGTEVKDFSERWT